VSQGTLAICVTVALCTAWLVLVLQDIARRAAGQRAMLYEQLWKIEQQQARHETLLSGIAFSVGPSRNASGDWLNEFEERLAGATVPTHTAPDEPPKR
jgi:hypothetical protein